MKCWLAGLAFRNILPDRDFQIDSVQVGYCPLKYTVCKYFLSVLPVCLVLGRRLIQADFIDSLHKIFMTQSYRWTESARTIHPDQHCHGWQHPALHGSQLAHQNPKTKTQNHSLLFLYYFPKMIILRFIASHTSYGTKRYRIQGGGDRFSVHFAVTFLDCWRTSFCVTTITKGVDLM